MGNCFSGESKSNNFRGEGQTLGGGGGNVPQATRPIPSQTKTKPPPKVGGPARTLGSSGSADDPRLAAARAAEARANKPQGTGPLADKLAAQKKAGMKGALQQASEENRRARDADAVAETRNYN